MADAIQSRPQAAADRRTAYLAAMRQVPGAIAIIACDKPPLRGGLAATAWTSLSADPPMMLACINRSASAHDLFSLAGGFSINLLADHDHETVAIFSGQRDLKGGERFLAGPWDAGVSGQPVLASAAASFECALVASHVYGTHTVLIGQVEAVHHAPGRAGLVYVDGRYATLAGQP